VRTFKVAIWVAFLLAAVLATSCSPGSRGEQGTGTTERSAATAPKKQGQQEKTTPEEQTAQRGAPFTATSKMKGG
jgi:hypothetical protein